MISFCQVLKRASPPQLLSRRYAVVGCPGVLVTGELTSRKIGKAHHYQRRFSCGEPLDGYNEEEEED
jgi:hypothetical protein